MPTFHNVALKIKTVRTARVVKPIWKLEMWTVTFNKANYIFMLNFQCKSPFGTQKGHIGGLHINLYVMVKLDKFLTTY